MARYQYRLAGTFEWFASSGSALVALTNKLGSAKKVNIRSVQISSLTTGNNTTAGAVLAAEPVSYRILTGGTVSGGSSVPLSALDTAAPAWPSTVRVLKNASHLGANTVGRGLVIRNLVSDLRAWMRPMPPSRWGGLARGVRRDNSTPVEKVTIRPGEAYSVRLSVTPQIPLPLRVCLTMRRQGSPARTWMTTYYVVGLMDNEALVAVDNAAGSGEVIEIVEVSVEEVGTFDSPYFQLVPVGTMNALSVTDPMASPPVQKMDTQYPDSSTWVQVFEDSPLLPRDVPENALSDASAGSPKGSNYLKAKDFIGPVYRTLFPEYVGISTIRSSDSLHHHLAPKKADVGVMRAGIVLRPGEGIALVSAAETAAIATAVGLSGWNAYEVTVVFDVEPLFEPTLTISGLQNPSEIRVFDAGTTTQLAGQENVTSGTFSWTYDPDVGDVDISILSLGYQNLRLLNVSLPSTADLTIPVQQQVDRQYENV